MYYINEYFGPAFVIKPLGTRMQNTITEKVYETCGNKTCKGYGDRGLFDPFCPHCGSRCGSFDIEIKRNLFVSDVSEDADNILVHPFNSIPDGDDVIIPKFSNEKWLTPLTKQHIIFKSVIKKCQNESCNNLDYDISFEHTYCSGCGVKAEVQVSEQYESSFSPITSKLFNEMSEKHSIQEFHKSFDISEANDNLDQFRSLKEIQELFNLLESIYGEGSITIENRHINFADNY